MPDSDIELPNRGYNTEDVRAQRPAERKRRRWGLWIFLILIVLPAALLALWTTITLGYTYSSGERAGYVQKFSRKGWLCKTWEGELAMANLPGTMPEIFSFSVRDDAVAEQINKTMGDRVALHYEQHKGVPVSCFGETQYFLDRVVSREPAAGAAPGAAPSSSGTAVPAGTAPATPTPPATPAPTTPRP